MTQRRRSRPRHPDTLTPAESRVLNELRKGGTNAEIAVRLAVSPDAIKFHISNLLAKLGLEDRQQLASWRPDGGRRRLRALLPLPATLGFLARPLVWVGAGTAVLAGAAAVAGVLVFVNGSGEPVPVAPPTTPTPMSPTVAGPSPQPTPTTTVSPAPTPHGTPTPAPTVTPSPTPTPTRQPTPTPTAVRLPETIDMTGAVTTAGSYSFMSEDEAGGMRPVTTYEELRDGSTTVLLIHKASADGRSRAAILDTVEANDLVEWHVAYDCFVRYRITDVKADPAGPIPRKSLRLEWMTYAFTGCSGAIASDVPASFAWGTLPDLGGATLRVPIVHSIFQIVPKDWTGSVEPLVPRELPPRSDKEPSFYTTLSDASANLPYWRTPTVPEGWVLDTAGEGGLADPGQGYCSDWLTEVREWSNPPSRWIAFSLCGFYAGASGFPSDASWSDGKMAHETRVIAGRPALLLYSPLGPSHNPNATVHIVVYDPPSRVAYKLVAYDYTLHGGNVGASIALVASLFEEGGE